MRIAICDDELIFHQILRDKLTEYSNNIVDFFIIDDFFSGTKFLHSKNEYDLVFMDYQINELNGMDTVKEFRKRNNDVIVIFLTSYPEIVYESFKVNTFRFLLKPIDDAALKDALNSVIKVFNSEKYIIITENSEIKKIKVEDIIYIEANNKSSIIRLINDIIHQPKLLQEYQKQLPVDQFYRVHKSFLINFKHIKSNDKTQIVFTNDERATVSKPKFAEFKRMYISYLERYTFGGK